MNGPYRIPNLENQGRKIGTINSPYFFQITSAQRHKKSLIFHAQILKRYYMYTIARVGSENLNLFCEDRKCKAKALCKIPQESCLIKENGERSNGKRMVKNYTLDFGDPRLRDLSEYIFLPKDSEPHTYDR